MYFDNLEDIKEYSDSIICFYSDNDPYVKYEVEKEFADTVSIVQVLIHDGGHINSESGYDTFEEIVGYL
jgi:predicted alpha/beta hydrolase family esterase